MSLADMLRHRPAHVVLAEIWRRVSPPQDPWQYVAWPTAALYTPTVYLPQIGATS
jgi:hypothetical protein